MGPPQTLIARRGYDMTAACRKSPGPCTQLWVRFCESTKCAVKYVHCTVGRLYLIRVVIRYSWRNSCRLTQAIALRKFHGETPCIHLLRRYTVMRLERSCMMLPRRSWSYWNSKVSRLIPDKAHGASCPVRICSMTRNKRWAHSR